MSRCRPVVEPSDAPVEAGARKGLGAEEDFEALGLGAEEPEGTNSPDEIRPCGTRSSGRTRSRPVDAVASLRASSAAFCRKGQQGKENFLQDFEHGLYYALRARR